MDRAARLLLLTAILLSTIAAIVASVRVIFGFTLGSNWYFAGVLAAYAGPLALAAALRLYEQVGSGVAAEKAEKR